MNVEQIKYMVNRFLGWRLPKPWQPDGGISYQRPNYAHAPAEHDWPTGTNLFDADQAEAMVRYMTEALPAKSDKLRWLIEAPGPHFLTVKNIGYQHRFHWTTDHNEAIRFENGAQADAIMMAIRTEETRSITRFKIFTAQANGAP